jgi:biphenyl 2,3-dioxygenase ferredoxin subunit
MPRKILLEIKKEDLRYDGITPFEIEGQIVAVCKMGDEYYAFPDTCTHEEWPLSESYFADNLIVCSLHGAAFDPRTGACRRGPATDPLIPYTVRQQDETLLIELEVA